jgi:hypothetical protein
MERLKFEWLSRESALYFRRADKFKDPLEGHDAMANPAFEPQWVALQKQSGFGIASSEAELHAQYQKMLNVAHEDKTNTFVNCWHTVNGRRRRCGKITRITRMRSAFGLASTRPFAASRRNAFSAAFAMSITHLMSSIRSIASTSSATRSGGYGGEREVRAMIWGKDTVGASMPSAEGGNRSFGLDRGNPRRSSCGARLRAGR